ncbi:MAG: helix-turn-helix transcriptional regulator [Eubacterium sp.]|nr:helix-turn-helix transcriptional regulator [Eubacterium sp.]
MEKIDGLYAAFTVPSDQDSRYFTLLDMFLSVMKILYENLDVKAYDTVKESTELTSLKNMLSYIEEHFAQRITLDNLAASGTCCKSRCSFLFKKFLHETPMTYIAKLRLQKSLVTLLDSDKSIFDIAYECGFCDASYYCKTFQRYYGISPLTFAHFKAYILFFPPLSPHLTIHHRHKHTAKRRHNCRCDDHR